MHRLYFVTVSGVEVKLVELQLLSVDFDKPHVPVIEQFDVQKEDNVPLAILLRMMTRPAPEQCGCTFPPSDDDWARARNRRNFVTNCYFLETKSEGKMVPIKFGNAGN